MKTKLTILIAIIWSFAYNVYADSPLTSTNISKAYQDVPIVMAASQAEGKLTNELMDYLMNADNPIDVRIALINELSWDHDEFANADIFLAYLISEEVFIDEDDFDDRASWDLLICMAYLDALDDYFNVRSALYLAGRARLKNRSSYTVNIIYTLIKAQRALHWDRWCEVYTLTDQVRKDASLEIDMRKEAIVEIFEYMDLYKKYCE